MLGSVVGVRGVLALGVLGPGGRAGNRLVGALALPVLAHLADLLLQFLVLLLQPLGLGAEVVGQPVVVLAFAHGEKIPLAAGGKPRRADPRGRGRPPAPGRWL